MNDYSELKRMAEAAPEGPWFGPEYAPGTSYVFDVDLGTLLAYESIESEKDVCLRYVAAANPTAVLALIADLEVSNNVGRALGETLGSVVESRDALVRVVDQLKAENEALCKDAERYRYVSDLAWYVERAAQVYNLCNVNARWHEDRGSPDGDDVEEAIDKEMTEGSDDD